MARGTDEATGQPTCLVKWRGLDYDKVRLRCNKFAAQESCKREPKSGRSLAAASACTWALLAQRAALGALCQGVWGASCSCPIASAGVHPPPFQATWEPAADLEGEQEALQQVGPALPWHHRGCMQGA